MLSPIKLHFYRSNRGPLNFGDELSPLIVEMVSKRPVIHSSIPECEIISLGSIFEGAYKKLFQRRLRFNTSPIQVWGSGFIMSDPINQKKFNKNFKIHAVRGVLSCNKLQGNCLALGDPGLLSKHLIEPQKKSIGTLIMPHIAHQTRPEILALKTQFKGCKIADLTQDPIKILKQISASERVISSSLHGLICADSLGVENIRLNLGSGLKGGNFKFDDYDTSIGRSIKEITGVELQADINNIFSASDFTYQQSIDDVCDNLIKVFPTELK
jgi:hypothetical protein